MLQQNKNLTNCEAWYVCDLVGSVQKVLMQLKLLELFETDGLSVTGERKTIFTNCQEVTFLRLR